MKQHIALIGGVTGTVGSALARELSARKDWKVCGVSRPAPVQPIEGVNYLQLDLNDRERASEGLADFEDVTHLFYVSPIDDRFANSYFAMQSVCLTSEGESPRWNFVNPCGL